MATQTKKVNYDLSWKTHALSTIVPFKCGALPALFERDPVHEEEVHIDKHRRRDQYSANIRDRASKMRFLTQEQFASKLYFFCVRTLICIYLRFCRIVFLFLSKHGYSMQTFNKNGSNLSTAVLFLRKSSFWCSNAKTVFVLLLMFVLV